MKYYWINCKNSINRRTYMESQFKNLKLINQRVDAFTPITLPQIIKLEIYKRTDLEMACTCSHFKALQQGINDGEEWFVVLEDDVKIVFDIDYDELIKSAKGAKIVQMHSSYYKLDYLKNKYIEGNLCIPRKKYMHGSCAYLININAAKKLINMFIKNDVYDFSNYNGNLGSDYILYELLKTYTCAYPLFYNDNNIYKSTIHNNHDERHITVMNNAKKIIDNIKPPYFCTKIIDNVINNFV